MNSERKDALPRGPITIWLQPLQRLMHVQAASGIVLMACTIVALAMANSPWAGPYTAFWKIPIVLSVGEFRLADTLGHLVINDGLMTLFFFVVGLEIKREFVRGELADPRQALLPVIAALGGMIVPAAVYLCLQWGQPGQRGWAVPMATDIAFVVGLLALFGPRAPLGLKIFLLTLAIVDDLGAVLLIASVFSKSIATGWLLAAAGGFALTILFNRLGVRSIMVYVLIGLAIWLAFLKAGIHPTVAGVLLGLLTPSTAWIGDQTFGELLGQLWETYFPSDAPQLPPWQELRQLRVAAMESVSPLERLEVALHPWVAFGVMPLFALANAGVKIEPSGLTHPVAIAVAAGLVIGKPLGIVACSAAVVRLGWAKLPQGVTWPMLVGGGCLAGIGFTMALFLNGLAFPGVEFAHAETSGKLGTLSGSLISAVLGATILMYSLRRAEHE